MLARRLLHLLGAVDGRRGSRRRRRGDGALPRRPLVDVRLVEEAGEQHEVREVHEQGQFDVLLADVARLAVLLQLRR